MNPVRFVTRIFIDVFGITRPTPEQEKRASWFITGLLGLLVLSVVVVFIALRFLVHH